MQLYILLHSVTFPLFDETTPNLINTFQGQVSRQSWPIYLFTFITFLSTENEVRTKIFVLTFMAYGPDECWRVYSLEWATQIQRKNFDSVFVLLKRIKQSVLCWIKVTIKHVTQLNISAIN